MAFPNSQSLFPFYTLLGKAAPIVYWYFSYMFPLDILNPKNRRVPVRNEYDNPGKALNAVLIKPFRSHYAIITTDVQTIILKYRSV